MTVIWVYVVYVFICLLCSFYRYYSKVEWFTVLLDLQRLADTIYYKIVLPNSDNKRVMRWVKRSLERQSKGEVNADPDEALIDILRLLLSRGEHEFSPRGLSKVVLRGKLRKISKCYGWAGNRRHVELVEWVIGKVEDEVESVRSNGTLKEYRRRILEDLGKILKKLNKLLGGLERGKSVADIARNMYEAIQKRQSYILGPKSIDMFLRDWGYLDCIPIDRHMFTFMVRTGIFREYITGNKITIDKTVMEDYYKRYYLFRRAMEWFCRNYMWGKTITVSGFQPVNLGNAPGILDYFIWYFCSEAKGYPNICIQKNLPKC